MVGKPSSSDSGASASSLGSGDEMTRNLRLSHPRLADDLVFSPLTSKGETVYHIEATGPGKYFRVGVAEYVFLSLFDGKTTFAEALAVTAQRLGADALSESQAMHVMTWLMQHQLVEGDGIPAVETPKPSGLARFNPVFNKIRLGCPDEFFTAATAALSWIFHPVSVACGIVAMIVAAGMLLDNMDRFAACSGAVFSPSNWVWLTITWIGLKVVHELGHGVACKRMGGKVSELGVLMILFAPLAYVDVTSSWRFASKWRRIGVALAGMYVEILVAALAVFGWVYSSSPLTEQLLYNVIVSATFATLLFNANPFMKFDGYYVLSDLTDTPNLYTKGTEAFTESCRWLFFGTRRGANANELAGRSRWIRWYGACTAMWKMMITLSIGLAAAAMFHKAGLVIVLIAGLLMTLQNAKKIIDTTMWHWRHRPASCLRAGALAGTIAVAGWFVWAWMPNPMALTAPGILQYEDAAVVRAETAGFVTRILVENGQPVKTGQPLLHLDSRELIAECDSLTAQLAETRMRESIAMDDGDAAATQVAAKHRQAIERRLADKQRQRDRLVVTAPVAGNVVGRDLAQKIGAYIDVGEEIVSIGNESKKEVVLSLQNKEIDDALKRVGQSVQVRLGSNRSVTAKLIRIQPRATVDLPHPALAATVGGPLPVQETHGESSNGETAFELIEPRFIANARLEPSDAELLACGQRGYARFGMRSDTFGQWLMVSTREWFQAKLDVGQ